MIAQLFAPDNYVKKKKMRKVSIACKEMTFSVPFEKKIFFFSPSFASKLFNSTELNVKWSPVQLHTASSSISLCKCDNQNKLILKINWFTVTSNRLDSSISQQLNIFFLCVCAVKKNFFTCSSLLFSEILAVWFLDRGYGRTYPHEMSPEIVMSAIMSVQKLNYEFVSLKYQIISPKSISPKYEF